jgi:hypothetical protein
MAKLITGAKFNIGTTPVKLTPELERKLSRVIFLTDSGNTDKVWVGREGLTAGASEETSGFPLAAGSSITLTDVDLGEFWVVASSGTQKIYWIGS